MNADGSNQTNLTNNPASDGPGEMLGSHALAWSPDGSKIAFISWRDDYNAEIYVMDADGSNQTNLSNSQGWDALPTWSPDGSKIAFFTEGNNGGIFVVDVDGYSLTNLTKNTGWDATPTWSP
jgi:TolB protein